MFSAEHILGAEHHLYQIYFSVCGAQITGRQPICQQAGRRTLFVCVGRNSLNCRSIFCKSKNLDSFRVPEPVCLVASGAGDTGEGFIVGNGLGLI